MDIKCVLIVAIYFAGVYCDCPAGWSTFKNRCYYVTTVLHKFNDAVNFCATKNATLPIYYSNSEWQYVQNITIRGRRLYQWAGIHYNKTALKWEWMDGKTKYTKSGLHWASGKEKIPSKTEKNRLCVGMYAASHGAVYLLSCFGAYQVVCQRPANVIDLCDANDGWKDISGQCYKYFEAKKTWRDARSTCQQNNGDLVVPMSYTEQLLLGDVVPCQSQANDIWIGISDILSPGRYLAIDTQPPVYQKWNSRVRYPVPGDSCVNALSGQNFYYESDSCLAEHTFICQKAYGTCPKGWLVNGASCYHLYAHTNITSWFRAKMACENQGTQLVIIDNMAENKFISKYLKSQKQRVTWIGFSEYNAAKTMQWLNGMSLSNAGVYTHWHRSYPVTLKISVTCGSILTGKADDNWLNLYCFTNRPFMCETSIHSRPTPKPALSLSCDTGWTLFNQDCYYIGRGKSRPNAFSYCQSVGAILATIRDPYEQAFIVKFKRSSDSAWIGLKYVTAQNAYVWDDFSVPKYTNYYPKEPNQKLPCIQIVGGSRAVSYVGSWEDMHCSKRNNFICRKFAVGASKTTPSSIKPTASWSARCGGPGWIDNRKENTCYQINTVRKKWADASKDCKNKGGDLMSINGPKEQIHLEATLSSSQFSYVQSNLWIGGSDRNDVGGWEWSDGSPFRYLNWHPGEPNMVGKGQNCMVLTTGAWNYQWDNNACTALAPYICEHKPYALPNAPKTTKPPVLQAPCKPVPILSGTYSIPNDRIEVTSSISSKYDAAASRIIRTNKACWSPMRDTILEAIDAKFYNIMVIKGIKTMGNPDNTRWVTHFKLRYQMDSFTPFYDYEDPPGTPKIFTANVNGKYSTTNMLTFPIAAKTLRLMPVHWKLGISLRWEILGCVEEDCTPEYGLSGPLIVQDGGYNASSMLDPQHSHANSRLLPITRNQPVACWKPLKTDAKSWIEVNLGMEKIIRGVTTMGNPSATEWVMYYKVSYWHDDLIHTPTFRTYQEPYGKDKVFRGNRRNGDKITNMFRSHFQASKIRIFPTSFHAAVALRFDIFVCPIACQDIPLISGPHKIRDEQLTASSRYDNDHGPMRSRLNLLTQGDFSGGWLAKFSDSKQYIQVDLGVNIQIVAIATQGRKDRDEYVRQFSLAYSTDGATYTPYSVNGNITLFDGNWDANSVRKQYLPSPVLAGYLQLWPTDWQKRIALRWEVYGCPGPKSSVAVGCYADHAADRDLQFEPITDPQSGMWPPMCVHHCYLKGFSYAGIQNRDNCYCGNSYGKYGVGLNCSIPCVSNKLLCGGKTDNLVYSTGLSSWSRVCADGWMAFGDKCYLVIQDKKSWSDARSDCQAAGAELIAISDKHEQDFVVSMTTQVQSDIWIGFNDLQTEMFFEWSNDEEVFFTNWNLAQPANPAGTEEDCVLLTYKTGGWQDERCNVAKKYMCEMEKQSSNMQTQSPMVLGCDQGWDGFQQSCYLYVLEPRKWSNAASVCRSNGGYLVRINDKYEQAYVSSKLGSASNYYWTDVTDADVGGTYIFADGDSTIPLTNWAQHKPDQQGQCVSLGTGKTAGLWFNMNCTTKLSAVCEKLKKGITTLPPATTPDSTIPCATGWTAQGIWCYQVNNMTWNLQVAWADAQLDCQSKGAELASFHNMTDLDTLYGTSLASGKNHFWIGLNDLSGKGYVYSDGTAVDFTSWGQGEPNNYQGTSEDCVEIKTNTGKFNDQDCSKVRNWVCGIRKGVTLQPLTTVVPPTAGPAGSCSPIGLDDKWKSYNGNCYLVMDGVGDTAKTWRSARDYCRKSQAELASITTVQEDLFIGSLIKGISSYSAWIGLNELNPDKGYSWSDGTPTKHFNWNLNEPNDYQGLEACVDILIRTGKWNDDHCDLRQAFICKRSLTGKTLPTTTPAKMPGNCPAGFSGYFGNKCFKIYGTGSKNMLNFTTARAACQGLGTGYSLATISNPLEQAFLTSLLPNVWWRVWIGLYVRDKALRWDDNEEAGFFNWAHGEPSSKGKTQQCVYVYGAHENAGLWSQAKCSNAMGYVCQTYRKASITTPAPIQTSCDTSNGFRQLNRDCVKLMTLKTTWTAARAVCQGMGADLASINSPYEQAFSYLLVRENANTKGPFWIGLNDMKTKGSYRWIDTWPITFTNWGDNQPNATVSSGCVSYDINGKWSDDNCNQKYSFFCKKTTATAPITPAPGTGQCPGSKWELVGRNCNRFDYSSRTYDLAVKFCKSVHANLISIHDDTTNTYIYSIFKEQINSGVWLGARRAPGASYKWLDKRPVDFTKWATGEPKKNDTGGEEILCAVIPSWQQGQWRASSCNRWMGTICQRPMKYDNNTNIFPTLGPILKSTPALQTNSPQVGVITTKAPSIPNPTKTGRITQKVNSVTNHHQIFTREPNVNPTFGGFGSQGTPLAQRNDDTDKSTNGLGAGGIAGVVIGTIAVIGFLLLGTIFVLRRRNVMVPGISRSFSNALYESDTANESVQFH